VLWSNIAELRLAEVARARRRRVTTIVLVCAGIALAIGVAAARLLR
jgi:hypothetical protein